MDFRQLWYGHNRSFAHKCFTNGLVLGALLSFYGLWTDFVSSAFWWQWGSYLAATLAFVSFVLICRGFITGQLMTQAGARFAAKAVGFIVLPFLLFAMWWLLVVRVIPDIGTRVLGTPVQITTPMRAVYSQRRRLCDYRLEGEILNRAYPHYLCTSPGFAVFPSDVLVIVDGKQTALGLQVERFFLSVSANKAFQATRETRALES